jgi:hypothetical protein
VGGGCTLLVSKCLTSGSSPRGNHTKTAEAYREGPGSGMSLCPTLARRTYRSASVYVPGPVFSTSRMLAAALLNPCVAGEAVDSQVDDPKVQ